VEKGRALAEIRDRPLTSNRQKPWGLAQGLSQPEAASVPSRHSETQQREKGVTAIAVIINKTKSQNRQIDQNRGHIGILTPVPHFGQRMVPRTSASGFKPGGLSGLLSRIPQLGHCSPPPPRIMRTTAATITTTTPTITSGMRPIRKPPIEVEELAFQTASHEFGSRFGTTVQAPRSWAAKSSRDHNELAVGLFEDLLVFAFVELQVATWGEPGRRANTGGHVPRKASERGTYEPPKEESHDDPGPTLLLGKRHHCDDGDDEGRDHPYRYRYLVGESLAFIADRHLDAVDDLMRPHTFTSVDLRMTIRGSHATAASPGKDIAGQDYLRSTTQASLPPPKRGGDDEPSR